MTYQEEKDNAKGKLGPYCKACNVCDGRACRNTIPGPGSKGYGDTAIRNFDAWKKIHVNMDTIHENFEPDTSFDFFGYKMKYPIFAGPIGAVNLHYGDLMNDLEYNDILIGACADAGILAFTGDGTNPEVVKAATKAIAAHGGIGVPTIKPWDIDTLKEKFELVRESGSFAVAMDIDAAGLPFLRNLNPPAGCKSTDEMKNIIKEADKPFVVKGIMTVSGAVKAREAGAKAIVVSNHGGRVLDGCPSTCEVLPEIAEAVGKDMMVLVDGGIRDGGDVFKALALGADGVIIARPYVTAVYGGGAEGVKAYTEKLGAELTDTMKMCGARNLDEITSDRIFSLE